MTGIRVNLDKKTLLQISPTSSQACKLIAKCINSEIANGTITAAPEQSFAPTAG